MHDIKFIKEAPQEFDLNLGRRGILPQSTVILELDERLRHAQTTLQDLQSKRNSLAKQIGTLKAKGEDASHLLATGEEIKNSLPQYETLLAELEQNLHKILSTLPNLLQEDVPNGETEEQNVEIKREGTPKLFPNSKQHFELGENLQMMDFATATKISGARFVILKDDLALMERALANFMLDIHTQQWGYTEVSVPYLVKEEAMFGVGQLPKMDQESFLTREGFRLIPTAEVSLTNMVADMIVDEEELPLRFTAYSPCFRSEAGSAGRDTRGMIRLHQFSKVELVSITRPQDSNAEHERMLICAESILQKLELPYRIMSLCSGDIGFSARKTYDIEVWLPGQNCYREISSCSNCGEFQARRMAARYKELTSRKNKYVHTLNGSGLAVGRTMVAILENYQNEDGSIAVPAALRSYMNGIEKIGGKHGN